MKKYSYEEALHRAAALCSMTEKSETDIHRKLLEWGLENSDCEQVLLYLKKENFINEERFAKAFVKDKFRFNHWGRIKISTHLRALGISSEHISNAMQEIDDEEYAKMLDEIVEKKRKTIKNGTDYEIRAKLLRHALSRGFEYDLVASKLNI